MVPEWGAALQARVPAGFGKWIRVEAIHRLICSTPATMPMPWLKRLLSTPTILFMGTIQGATRERGAVSRHRNTLLELLPMGVWGDRIISTT